MVRPLALKGWCWVPYEHVRDLAALRSELTYTPKFAEPDDPPVVLYEDHSEWEMIGVPASYGLRVFAGVEVDDARSDGEPLARHPGAKLPTPRDSRQAEFMAAMNEAAREHQIFNACAPTGTGKTVAALNTVAHLGRKTLVLVHLDALRQQWIREIRKHLGVPMRRIGTPTDFHDKDFVVATLQSVALAPGQRPDAFYNGFGTVIFDEVHRAGAPVFSQAVWQFPARYRIGLSATLRRKDGGDRVFTWHLGPARVTSEQEAMPIQVWPRWYHCGKYQLWGWEHGSRMKCLSLDRNRNQRIAGIIKKMYDGERNSLVVADTINHLKTLRRMVVEAGVPESETGMFVGSEPYVERKPVAGTDRVQEVRKTRQVSKRELERVKRESRIIFATYSMMKEGVDIPRLDAGIDATPRSDAEQLIGRIRRRQEGKKSPVIWVTIVDSQCDRSLNYYHKRLVEYRRAGAEVVQ